MHHHLRKHAEFLKFLAVGLSTMALSFATLVVGVELLKWHPTVAYVVQALVAIQANFVLNYKVTFKRKEKDSLRNIAALNAAFLGTRLTAMGLNQLLYMALVFVGAQYVLANIMCVAINTAFTYTSSRRVFKSSNS